MSAARLLGSWSAAGSGVEDTPEVGLATAVSARSTGTVSLVVGEGDPLDARRGLLAAVGCDLDRGVAMQQVHGGSVAVVGETDAGRGMRRHADAIAGVDGLVTFVPGLALLVMVADCVPVLLHAPHVGVAAVHAGRGGVVAGVVERAVAALTDDPAAVEALIGPAIGGCCYEVPPEMAAEIDQLLPGTAGSTQWGSPSLDLPAAVRLQLARAGVARVFMTGSCTRCEASRWFSHRADPGAGRQAAVVVRHEGHVPCVDGAAAAGRLDLHPAPSPHHLTGSAGVAS